MPMNLLISFNNINVVSFHILSLCRDADSSVQNFAISQE